MKLISPINETNQYSCWNVHKLNLITRKPQIQIERLSTKELLWTVENVKVIKHEEKSGSHSRQEEVTRNCDAWTGTASCPERVCGLFPTPCWGGLCEVQVERKILYQREFPDLGHCTVAVYEDVLVLREHTVKSS